MLKCLWVGAVLLLGLALFSLPASAYPDFYLSLTPNALSACPCGTIGSFTGHGSDIRLALRNQGDIADTYDLYLELPGGEWSGFIYSSKREITLGPDEERVIEPVWITPGCTVKPGTYTVTIRAKSKTSGDERRADLGLKVLKCHQADLEVPKSGGTCRGIPLEVEMKITNYGKYEERFVPGASVGWAKFSADRVSLKSGEQKTITMLLKPPRDMTGIESITVSMKSLDSYAEDSETFRLDIQDCYSFEANLEPASQPVCRGKHSEYTLRISNTGSRRDSYSIYTQGWVSPSSGTASIGPGGSTEIILRATPAETGKPRFNVTVVSSMQPAYPELRRVLEGVADVRECRGVAVVVSPSSLEICSQEGAEFQVTVKNIGTVDDTFRLDCPLGILEQEKLVLGAGESRTVKVFINPGIPPGKKTVKAGASSDGIYDEDEAELLVENCYSGMVSIGPGYLSLCPCTSAGFEAVLENTGKYRDNYTFSLEVPGSMGNGTEKTPELMPGESETLELEISVPCGMEAGDYEIKASAESENAWTSQKADITVKTMEECYSLELSAGEASLRTVRGKAAVFTITARNLGDAGDSYRLFLEGPDWSYLGTEALELEPGESKTVYLYASPEYGSELKEYGLEVRAVSGRAMAEISLTLDVAKGAAGEEPQPPENETPSNATPSGNVTENITASNVTANVSMNVSIPTGQAVGEGVILSWKVIAVTIIALAIVVILITRFAVLIR